MSAHLLYGQTVDTIYYSQENTIKAVEIKEDGEYHGEYRMWYPNGQLKMQGMIENGKWKGKWVYYNPTGVLHKTGEYVNSLRHGLWSIYNLKGELIGEKTYDNGKLLKLDFTENKENVYFEYDCEVAEDETIRFKSSIETINPDEFKLFEPIMLSNVSFVEQNPFAQELGPVSQFVSIWTSNNPHLGGKVEIDVTNYMLEWTILGDTYKHTALMAAYYYLGKCAYLIENKGKKFDAVQSDYRATESMIRGYQAILLQEDAENDKLNVLREKYNQKTLLKFIRKYHKKK